jgi:hypothetical protein
MWQNLQESAKGANVDLWTGGSKGVAIVIFLSFFALVRVDQMGEPV